MRYLLLSALMVSGIFAFTATAAASDRPEASNLAVGAFADPQEHRVSVQLSDDDVVGPLRLRVEYSLNKGRTYHRATVRAMTLDEVRSIGYNSTHVAEVDNFAASQVKVDAKRNTALREPALFIWESLQDLPTPKNYQVKIRVTPYDAAVQGAEAARSLRIDTRSERMIVPAAERVSNVRMLNVYGTTPTVFSLASGKGSGSTVSTATIYASVTGLGDWEKKFTFPDNTRDAFFASSGDTVYAVGLVSNKNVLAVSTDGGATWSQPNDPVAVLTSTDFEHTPSIFDAVVFNGALYVSMGLKYGSYRLYSVPKIVRTRDNGATWETVVSNGFGEKVSSENADDKPVTYDLEVFNNRIYAGTTKGVYASTTGDLNGWSKIDEPATTLLLFQDRFYAVHYEQSGGEFGKVDRVDVTADGVTWSSVAIGEWPTLYNISRLRNATNAAYAMDQSGVTYETRNFTSWRRVFVNTARDLPDVYFLKKFLIPTCSSGRFNSNIADTGPCVASAPPRLTNTTLFGGPAYSVRTMVRDLEQDTTLQLRLDYSLDDGRTWKKATVKKASTSKGAIDINNDAMYQIGTSSSYVPDRKTVTVVWDTAADGVKKGHSYRFRLTPYDGWNIGAFGRTKAARR